MRRRRSLLLFALLAAASTRAGAAQSRTIEFDPSDLSDGVSSSVLVTNRGRLAPAPAFARLGPAGPLSDAAHAWAVAADARGGLLVATGSDGKVVRVAPGGAVSVAFVSPEPLVTALLTLPGGDVLAATAPGGKIYRIAPGGRNAVWCETGEAYVWSLVATPDGTIHAATGDHGILLRIDRNGRATPEFDSDQPHLTALAVLPDGSLAAGSAGSGKVFRIGKNGSREVLYEGDLAEVSDLVVEQDGSLVAGFLASLEPDPRPPAVRIQVAGGGARSPSDAVTEMDDRGASSLEGIIEGLPSASEGRSSRRARGRVIRIAASGTAKELWRSAGEAVLAVGLDASGQVVFGTGEPARLYRIAGSGEVERLATLPEGQVTAIGGGAAGIALVTSNPASAYRIDDRASPDASFVGAPVDAEAPAHWGTLRFRAARPASGIAPAVEARTGNSAVPDVTWSDWSRPSATAGAPLVVPDGRYLQWRVRWAGAAQDAAGIEGISVSYMPVNRPPTVDTFRIEGGKLAFSDKVPFRWSATDPDGDPLSVTIEYRPAGGSEWATALRVDPREPVSGGDSDSDETDGKGSWDVSGVAEGDYEVRAAISDATGNREGEGAVAYSMRTLALTLDRTPPELRVRRTADGGAEVSAEDALSPVSCLDLTESNRTVHSIAPEDGVCDGRREVFVVRPSELEGTATRTLRLTDAAGNVVASPVGEGNKK